MSTIDARAANADPSAPMTRLQRRRRALQAAFFALFLLAPALDLLRFDLHEAQLWVLGQRWSLGIDAFVRGELSATQAALAILLRGIVPGVLLIVAFLAVAWRYGRLYCGWLCPHFSMVEMLNDLLHRATGRFSIWERRPTAMAGRSPRRGWWLPFGALCVAMGFVWAVTLETYLLPPREIWGGILHGGLTANQTRFLLIAWAVFAFEFAFARHLFCRFGCAVGFFQSVAWMANPRALVVAFDGTRGRECQSCRTPRSPQGSACDHACPMRLQPRQIKRLMFTCVQCGRCVQACADNHAVHDRQPNLEWHVGLDAVRATLPSAPQRRAD